MDRSFRSFTRNERQRLVNYVRSMLRDTADMDAEDVVQDVLLKMLERVDQPAPEQLAAYVYRSLRNRVIDYTRTRKPTMSLDAELNDGGTTLIDLLQDGRPNALEILQSDEGKRELFEALDSLSEIERDVVIAHEFEGTHFREMSAMWDVPQNTLLSHKARAMKKLKTHFQKS